MNFFKKIAFFFSCLFWRIVWWGKHRAGFLDLGRDISVTGEVVWSDHGDNPDGDFTFNLKPDPEFLWAITTFGGRLTSENELFFPESLHCEVTPWTRPELTEALKNVTVGARVTVTGRWGFDGVHTGRPEWLEILYGIWGHGPNLQEGWCELHPVSDIIKTK